MPSKWSRYERPEPSLFIGSFRMDDKKRPIVLVVEDEVLIRMFAVDVIRDAGFEVVEAADADEAIAVLESRNDIEVVFTDIHMPGPMDGMRLAAAIRNRWPPVKIIATSGRTDNFEKHLPAEGRFIPKPYDAQQVGRAIREIVG